MSDHLMTSRQMQGLAPLHQATQAIQHILEQARRRPHWGYYLGLGTESWGLLTEALATLTDTADLAALRERWLCPNPQNPAEDEDLMREAREDAKSEWEPNYYELIEAIRELYTPTRLELLEALRDMFCFDCGGVSIFKPCGCRPCGARVESEAAK